MFDLSLPFSVILLLGAGRKHEKQLNMSVSPDCGLFWVNVVMLGFPSMKNSGLSHANIGLLIPINPYISGLVLVVGLEYSFIL